jgi:hypothetical protein
MDWFTPLVGFIGLAIGLGYQEYRIRRERKGKYKDMIFEKRLEAHQGAHYGLKRLSKFMLPYELMKDGGLKALHEEMSKYYDWIDKNVLYLDGDSRRKISLFSQYAWETMKKYQDAEWIKNINVKEEIRKLIDNMATVLVSIERGIGVNYLPEEKMSLEESLLEKMFDEAVGDVGELVKKQKS